MLALLVGSIVLSLVHATIPSHWLPIIAVGKSERWSRSETLWMTAITGTAHTMSTILIGIVVGLIGYRLSSITRFSTHIIAPMILVVLGAVFILLDLKSKHHHHHTPDLADVPRRSKLTVMMSLGLAMFLSPCLDIDAYFFTAGTYGTLGITALSLIYLVVTVSGMLVLVDLGSRGIERIKWHFLEHRERTVSGVVLIALGIVAYFIHG
jgi:nickel/cobalt exporter